LEADVSSLKVSVVLPWHREKWEHLKGTMLAMLHYTPDELIEEFLFVSDGNANTREKELKAITPKARFLNLPKREGLIRAKMQGVELAKGPVIMFMEAHCIVNREWLQPLLHRLLLNPKTLAMPTLDYIPQDNWHSYSKIPAGHWRFEWNLNLVYTNPGGALDFTAEPYASPGTSGGIFVMRKDWFQELKLFDPGMYEWGGDHLELTMKVWRCGGRIEIIPCSRIGHLYRDPTFRPYDVNVMRVVENYARLARIWFKDHLPYFYKMKPEARGLKFTDMDELMQAHDELSCKNLSWYLEYVDHEMAWEMDKLCHPYVGDNDPIKCKGKLAQQRWTIEESKLMPRKEFEKARDRAAAALEGTTAPSMPSKDEL
jgi:polypeptide N-acetylgalactosaminyltransferase